MSDKKKYRKHSPDRIRDYLSDRMSGEERNAFEKTLQKDPFAEEALEGLASLSEEELNEDLLDLRSRLSHSGSGSGRRIMWYRIAAAVAGLVLVTSVYLAFDQKIKGLKHPAVARTENPVKESVPEEPEGEHIKENTPARSETKPPAAASKQKEVVHEETRTEELGPVLNESKSYTSEKPNTSTQNHKSAVEQAEKTDQKSAAAISPPEASAVNPAVHPTITADEKNMQETLAGAASGVSVKKDLVRKNNPTVSRRSASPVNITTDSYVTGTISSSEDTSPVAGATILIEGTSNGTVSDVNGSFRLQVPPDSNVTLLASFIGMEPKEVVAKSGENLNIPLDPSITSLDEVVVIAYGQRVSRSLSGSVKTENEGLDTIPEYYEPTPVGGFDGFKTYIKTNIRFPEDHPDLKKTVVVLKFYVGPDNRPVDFEILKSPGKDFSDEAIRLLKNGPDWYPAKSQNMLIYENTTVRIVFRKE